MLLDNCRRKWGVNREFLKMYFKDEGTLTCFNIDWKNSRRKAENYETRDK